MRARLLAITMAASALVACARSEPAPEPAIDKTIDKAPSGRPSHAALMRPRPAQLTQVTIKALGMYCEESCPLKVRTALADLPAVYELGFDVSTESIFISYDATLGAPKAVTRPMLAAVKSAGFDPWLAKESWPESARAVVQVVPTN